MRKPSMHYPTPCGPARQVASACRDLVRRPGLPFAEHLPQAQIDRPYRDAGATFRERIFTPALTLCEVGRRATVSGEGMALGRKSGTCKITLILHVAFSSWMLETAAGG